MLDQFAATRAQLDELDKQIDTLTATPTDNPDDIVKQIEDVNRERGTVQTKSKMLEKQLIGIESKLDEARATLSETYDTANKNYRRELEHQADELMRSEAAEVTRQFIAARAYLLQMIGGRDWRSGSLEGLEIPKKMEFTPTPGVRFDLTERSPADKQRAELKQAAKALGLKVDPPKQSDLLPKVRDALCSVTAALDDEVTAA